MSTWTVQTDSQSNSTLAVTNTKSQQLTAKVLGIRRIKAQEGNSELQTRCQTVSKQRNQVHACMHSSTVVQETGRQSHQLKYTRRLESTEQIQFNFVQKTQSKSRGMTMTQRVNKTANDPERDLRSCVQRCWDQVYQSQGGLQ